MRILVVAAALSLAATQAEAGEVARRLDGTWISDVMTVTIDTAAGTYTGVALGQPFSRKLTVVAENANVVTFTADASTIVAQIGEDGGVIMTKQPAGMPIKMRRK